MKIGRAVQIKRYWEIVDDGEMSTEMLFSLVAHHFNIDNGDVAEALYMTRTPEKSITQKNESQTTLFPANREIRQMVSRVLVSHNLRTDQVAIGELTKLIEDAFGQGKQEGWNDHKEIGDVR